MVVCLSVLHTSTQTNKNTNALKKNRYVFNVTVVFSKQGKKKRHGKIVATLNKISSLENRRLMASAENRVSKKKVDFKNRKYSDNIFLLGEKKGLGAGRGSVFSFLLGGMKEEVVFLKRKREGKREEMW